MLGTWKPRGRARYAMLSDGWSIRGWPGRKFSAIVLVSVVARVGSGLGPICQKHVYISTNQGMYRNTIAGSPPGEQIYIYFLKK